MTPEEIKSSIISAYRAEKEEELKRKKAQREEETEKAVSALARRLNDARQTHRKALERNEARRNEAARAAAIYSELRGDRGGIGKAEFNGAYANAAADRREIDAALANEKRAVDDGIEEKLNALNKAGQADAEKAAADISAKESELNKWAYEKAAEEKAAADNLALREAALTGQYKGEATADAKENALAASAKEEKEARESLREACFMLLNKGIMPSEEQLKAAGLTEEQAKEYISALLAAEVKGGAPDPAVSGSLGPAVIANPNGIKNSGKNLSAY